MTGCSGGSSSSSTTDTLTTTGIFLDSTVSGLSYTCSSGSTGLTSSSGEFTCITGDTITFNIGLLSLGNATVSSTISPYDLYSSSPTVMINILQVLQTLDNDNNASNGIEISEASRAKFAGYTGTIESDDFDSDAEVVIASVLITPTKALKHFNETLTETNNKNLYFLIASSSNDTNADGTVNTIDTLTWDSNLNIEKVINTNLDGSENTTTTYTYDNNRNQLTQSTDSDGDGIINSSMMSTYDNNGNQLTQSTDSDGDGIANYSTIYTYDINGTTVTASDGDGIITSIVQSTYDTDGNELTSQLSDGDGSVIWRSTFTFDRNGKQVTQSIDSDGDGMPNSIETFTHTFIQSNIRYN